MERGAEGTLKHLKDAVVVVFPMGIEYSKTDAKEVFNVTTPEQLQGFASNQESYMEKVIDEVAASGANLVIAGGKVSEMAMHFIEKKGLMVLKTTSKFELARICRVTGATPLVRLGAPTKEELGFADVVTVEEIGSTRVTMIKREGKSKIATVLCRGATANILDDLERAINDAVNSYKAVLSDSRLVPGAGASEIELAKQLKAIGEATPGQDQYSIRKFGESLEVVPRTLAENSGHDATAVISKIYAAHAAGNSKFGLNVETGEIVDAEAMKVLDLLSAKKRAIQLAVEASITVLRIDQIIMSKPAVGPKAPRMGPMDAD
jgi:T-complex protein 1 subunit theta